MINLQRKYYQKVKNSSIFTICKYYGLWSGGEDVPEEWDDTLDYLENVFIENRPKGVFIEFLLDISIGRYEETPLLMTSIKKKENK